MTGGAEFLTFALILGGYAVWVVGMYAAALVRGYSWRKRDDVSRAIQPQIRESLIDYLSGSDDQSQIRQFLRQSRRDVGDVLVSFRSTVGGAARDRLCELALEHALVHDWLEEAHSKDLVRRRVAFERLAFICTNEPCRRVAGDMIARAVDDSDPEVRFSAALAVLESGGPGDVERVFQMALTKDRLARIQLAEELRRHSAFLCKRAIPQVLASHDDVAVLAALEMFVAWERALPLEDLRVVLRHSNRDIRLQALRLTPLVPVTADTQSAIVDSLSDDDPEVVAVACDCAARLRLEAALPALARLLRHATAPLARAAASTLAALPPRGWTTLEELGASGNPVTATAAREALERAGGKGGA
jgi:hypothetical protein